MASIKSTKGSARSSPHLKESMPDYLGKLHFISFNHPIHANNNKFLLTDPLGEHIDCPIWERALHDFVKVTKRGIESVQVVATKEHYRGDKVPLYSNLNGRRTADLILRLINEKEAKTQPLAGPSTVDKLEEEEGQEVEALIHNSDQDFNLVAPTQEKGKAPVISLTVPQSIISAPPTASKPVTLSVTAPKTSAPTTPAPQVQTGSRTQGPSTSSSSQQPTQPQTTSQPLQQSAPPPPPPPPARQITATMATALTKVKWALPNQFTGKPDKLSDLRGKEFISSLNLYFIHYDNDYGGAAATRTQAEQKERVLFTLSLCTKSAFPWADVYTSKFTVPTTDLEKEYI
ncbi:hypothetical protein FRB95_013257 [Tulasnella sp. JGI-2019a]|nr:hypothetical protein FRB95_013257 [Tulasnella sp. JGI-2019a]